MAPDWSTVDTTRLMWVEMAILFGAFALVMLSYVFWPGRRPVTPSAHVARHARQEGKHVAHAEPAAAPPVPGWWQQPAPADEATPIFWMTGAYPTLDVETFTGAWNRRALRERLDEVWQDAGLAGLPRLVEPGPVRDASLGGAA